jgi:hypothetical protein
VTTVHRRQVESKPAGQLLLRLDIYLLVVTY